jgi:hypothetical protein
MGVDLADFNNDARPDIMVLDMLPPGPPRRKMVSTTYGYTSPRRARRLGYELQYTRNTLQLNNGRTPEGGLRFSEISQLAGVDATDWSWAPLFADFDNNGDLDLFVSNGYGEDVTNLNFARRRQQMLAFGTDAAQREELLEAMKALPKVELPNYFFMNDGHPGASSEQRLQFVDQTGTWARRKPGISNGAAVADLDGDGDLDLVTNNIDEEATLLENRASERAQSHFLRIQLRGPAGNRGGLGAKVVLYNDGTRQYREYTRHRGYQSTVEEGLHFGLGADSTADSVRVTWPDGRAQRRTDVTANQEIEIRYDSTARRVRPGSTAEDCSVLFREETARRGLVHRHVEKEMSDFEALPLLPHRLSQNEPGIAVGDLSGNGHDDIFVGAERGQEPVLFRQTGPGRFQKEHLPIGSKYEDEGALVFDADGDGHRDLYVVSGGSAIAGGTVRPSGEALFQDRLYRNDGTGNLRRVDDALPEVTASGSVVTAADYDGDGDLDLFVGGRLRPGEYPLPPHSVLLRNDSEEGDIRFTDVTDDVAPELTRVGLVSDALWTDYNDDGRLDLMVVGEWMPITVFEQRADGTFVDRTEAAGLGQTAGW